MPHQLQIISIPDSSSKENLAALAEVSAFGKTDMGNPSDGLWTYRMLEEPALTEEINRLSNPHSIGLWADSAALQPCLAYQSQDRSVIEEWCLGSTQPKAGSNTWRFCAVFDGHVTRHTVDYVSGTLPSAIKNALQGELLCNPITDRRLSSEQVSKVLKSCIEDADKRIRSEFLGPLPSVASIPQLQPDDIRAVFPDARSDDEDSGEDEGEDAEHRDYQKSYMRTVIGRALGGSTILLCLTDLSQKMMWIANLGDGYAVLGKKTREGWKGSLINNLHNARNPEEVKRIQSEHPPPETPIQKGRILGYLEPTRGIGDLWLKLPAIYSRGVFPYLEQDWVTSGLFIEHSRVISTPPYVLSTPDIFSLPMPDGPFFVMLSTDGLLVDITDEQDMQELVNKWTKAIGKSLDGNKKLNPAVAVIKEAIGGDNHHSVSKNLTVEMDEPWLDDMTVTVQKYNIWT